MADCGNDSSKSLPYAHLSPRCLMQNPSLITILHNLLWVVAGACPFWKGNGSFGLMLVVSLFLVILANVAWVFLFSSRLLISLAGEGIGFALRTAFRLLTSRHKPDRTDGFDFEASAERCLRSSAWPLFFLPLVWLILALFGNDSAAAITWKTAFAVHFVGGMIGFLLASRGKIVPLPLEIS